MSTQVSGRFGVVDRQSDRAVFRQIADHLIALIEDGDIGFGQKLPSETALVEHYGVARTTVRQALSELRLGGYTRSEQGRGVFANLRELEQKEVPIPGIHRRDGVVYLVRPIDESTAEVYRLPPAITADSETPWLIGYLEERRDPSDFWPHYSWLRAPSGSWTGHELDIRNWRDALNLLLDEEH